jgi:hypothetical protein
MSLRRGLFVWRPLVGVARIFGGIFQFVHFWVDRSKGDILYVNLKFFTAQLSRGGHSNYCRQHETGRR